MVYFFENSKQTDIEKHSVTVKKCLNLVVTIKYLGKNRVDEW